MPLPTCAAQAVVIPAGHFIASVSVGSGSTFLRWCVAASTPEGRAVELAAMRPALQQLLDGHPGLATGLHGQWREHLASLQP